MSVTQKDGSFAAKGQQSSAYLRLSSSFVANDKFSLSRYTWRQTVGSQVDLLIDNGNGAFRLFKWRLHPGGPTPLASGRPLRTGHVARQWTPIKRRRGDPCQARCHRGP